MRTTTTLEAVWDNIPNKTRNKNFLKPLCGLPLSPYFSALKIRWLIDNISCVKQAVDAKKCAFGTIDTWLIWVSTKIKIKYFKCYHQIPLVLRILQKVNYTLRMCQMHLVQC